MAERKMELNKLVGKSTAIPYMYIVDIKCILYVDTSYSDDKEASMYRHYELAKHLQTVTIVILILKCFSCTVVFCTWK